MRLFCSMNETRNTFKNTQTVHPVLYLWIFLCSWNDIVKFIIPRLLGLVSQILIKSSQLDGWWGWVDVLILIKKEKNTSLDVSVSVVHIYPLLAHGAVYALLCFSIT